MEGEEEREAKREGEGEVEERKEGEVGEANGFECGKNEAEQIAVE